MKSLGEVIVVCKEEVMETLLDAIDVLVEKAGPLIQNCPDSGDNVKEFLLFTKSKDTSAAKMTALNKIYIRKLHRRHGVGRSLGDAKHD